MTDMGGPTPTSAIQPLPPGASPASAVLPEGDNFWSLPPLGGAGASPIIPPSHISLKGNYYKLGPWWGDIQSRTNKDNNFTKSFRDVSQMPGIHFKA